MIIMWHIHCTFRRIRRWIRRVRVSYVITTVWHSTQYSPLFIRRWLVHVQVGSVMTIMWRYAHHLSPHWKVDQTCSGEFCDDQCVKLYTIYWPMCKTVHSTRCWKIQQYKCETHGFRTFSCSGPHIWNLLPQDLRHCSTLSSFKAKLKTFLFSHYFHPS